MRDRRRRHEAKTARTIQANHDAVRLELAAMKSHQDQQFSAMMDMISAVVQRPTPPSPAVSEVSPVTTTTPATSPPPAAISTAASSTVLVLPGTSGNGGAIPVVSPAGGSQATCSSWAMPAMPGPSTWSASGGLAHFQAVGGTSTGPMPPIATAWLPSTSAPTLAPSASAGGSAPPLMSGGCSTPSSEGNAALMVGLISGPRVSPALKEKIWRGDYVPFWDLLHPDLDAPSDQDKEASRPKRKTLSGLEWHRAFLSFVGIRGEKFPQEIEALLRYGTFIGELMEQQVDWALYDRRFRWDKATDPQFLAFPWSQIRQQVVNEAYRSCERKPGGGMSAQATFRANLSGIPSGYCFKHHEDGSEGCVNKACNFIHKCPKCLGNHALHQHHSSRSRSKRSPPRKRPHTSKSANSYKERRRL